MKNTICYACRIGIYTSIVWLSPVAANIDVVEPVINVYTNNKAPASAKTNQVLNNDVITKENLEKIKIALLNKYKTLDEIALNVQNLNNTEMTVAGIMFLEEQRLHREVQKKAQLELDVGSIDQALKEQYALQSTTLSNSNITNKRKLEKRIEKSSRVDLYETKTTIRPLVIDPESNDIINVNFALNKPATITFFDEQGHPFPITDIAPNSNAYFDRNTVSSNIVMFSAKEEYRTANGFIFLDSVSQPIPIMYSMNPEKSIDTKIIVTITGRSPTNKAEFKSLGVDITPFSNLTSETAFQILNGSSPANAQRLIIDGKLPAGSKAWEVIDKNGVKSHWVRTKAAKRYEYIKANKLGQYFAYQLTPRTKHWFLVDGQRVAIRFIHKTRKDY